MPLVKAIQDFVSRMSPPAPVSAVVEDDARLSVEGVSEYLLEIAHAVASRLPDSVAREMQKKLAIPSAYHDVLELVQMAWKEGGDSMISNVMSLMHHSLGCAGCEIGVTGDQDEELTTFLHHWAAEVVNRDWSPAITPGYESFRVQFYNELLTSGMVIPIVQWGRVDWNGMKVVAPIRIQIPSAYHIRVRTKGKVGDYDYYLKRPKLAEQDYEAFGVTLSDERGLRRYLDDDNTPGEKIQVSNAQSFSVHHLPDHRWHEPYPRPYLARTGALLIWRWKNSIRQMDYRTTAGLIASILLFTLGGKGQGKELSEYRPGYPTNEDLDAFQSKLQEALEQSALMVAPYGVEGKHIHPDTQALLSQEKYAEVDFDMAFALGLYTMDRQRARDRRMFNPIGLLTALEGFKWTERQMFIHRLIGEMKRRNNSAGLFKGKQKVALIQKIPYTWLTNELRDIVDREFERGQVSQQSLIEINTPLDYATELDRRRREKASGEEEVMTSRVVFRQDVGQGSPPSPAAGRSNDDDENATVTAARGEGKGVGGPPQGDGGATSCICPKCGAIYTHEKGTSCAERECPKCHVPLKGRGTGDGGFKQAVLGNLPAEGQKIWEKVFEARKASGDAEDLAAQKAWAAVKQTWEKVKGQWVKKSAAKGVGDA